MSSPDQNAAVRAALRRLTIKVDGLDQRAADHFGLNRSDLRCLDVLRATGPTTPTTLAAAIGMTSGGLSLALDRLELAGYVARRPNTADRRSVWIEATDELARVEGEVFGPLGKRMTRIIARYPDHELAVIQDFLERAAEAVAAAPQSQHQKHSRVVAARQADDASPVPDPSLRQCPGPSANLWRGGAASFVELFYPGAEEVPLDCVLGEEKRLLVGGSGLRGAAEPS